MIQNVNSLKKEIQYEKTWVGAFISIIFMAISFLWAIPIYAVNTSMPEKPLVIKGLQIGMNAEEAKIAIDKALNNGIENGWSASAVDKRSHLIQNYKSSSGDNDIFDDVEAGKPVAGDIGILIKNKSGYYGGYIGISESDNKVTQISFSGRLTNDLFSATNITADDFINSLTFTFNMPDFYWVARGWKYESPLGYSILFKTDKRLEIKKDTQNVQQQPNTQRRSLVDFN